MPSATGIPAVSVVLPTYNRAHLLPRAIQSVLDQTYTDFELLVVDDGSTDETPAVMESFTDDRIRYIRYEPNRGANAARNVGIRAARAPYIAFQDSDDDWFPEKLERCMAVWEDAGPEVGVVYSGYWKYMDAEGNRMFIPFDWVKQRDGWIHDELLRNNFVTTQAAVVRRECFDRSGYWLEGLPGKQEWELFLRISRDYQFRYIDEPLLNSRFTEGGISNNRMRITGRWSGSWRSTRRLRKNRHPYRTLSGSGCSSGCRASLKKDASTSAGERRCNPETGSTVWSPWCPRLAGGHSRGSCGSISPGMQARSEGEKSDGASRDRVGPG